MSNLTINRIGPEAQADSAWHDEDIEAARFAPLDVRPAPARWRGRDLLGAVLAGLAGWLVLLLVFWLAARLTEASYPPPLGWLLFWQSLLAATAAAPVLGATLWAVAWWRERQAYVTRARLARDRLMNPVPADLLARMTPSDYVRIVDLMAALERDTAPYRAYRGVESLSLSAPAARPSGDERKAIESVALALPVDQPAVWLEDAARNEVHLLLAGKTKSGKTVTGAALLASRINAGDQVLVIDPHHEPGKWWGIEAVGAGRDYGAIKRAIEALEAEMTERYRRMAAGQPVGERITVLIDETPAIVAAIGPTWRAIAPRLGSEARKAGIGLILLSQSPLVEDIGLNSAMRRNYAIIGLDLASIRLMLRDEPDAAIKRALLDALEGERYPALREVAGQFRILDRAGLDRIRPVQSPNVWRPVSQPAALPAARDAGDGDAGQSDDAALLITLRKLRSAGVTRDEARALGIEFRNELWALAAPHSDAHDAHDADDDGRHDAPAMHAARATPASASERAACAHDDVLAELLSRPARLPEPSEMVRCVRCGADVPVPAGKAAMAVRAATGRHGCRHCRPAQGGDA